VAVGGLIALLALGRVAGAYRAGWLSLVNAALAAWLFIAAFTLDNGGAAMWNDWILGVVIFVVATASTAATGRLVARRRPPTDVRP
jgi:hypothetical protein